MGTLKHLKPVMVKLSRLHTCHAVPSFNVQVKAQDAGSFTMYLGAWRVSFRNATRTASIL